MAEVPSNKAQWEAYIQSYGLEGKSIHSGLYTNSASEISFQQFLLLRVIWVETKKPKDYLARRDTDQAQQLLLGRKGWKKFVEATGNREYPPSPDMEELGNYGAAFHSIVTMLKSSGRHDKIIVLPKVEVVMTRLQAKILQEKQKQEDDAAASASASAPPTLTMTLRPRRALGASRASRASRIPRAPRAPGSPTPLRPTRGGFESTASLRGAAPDPFPFTPEKPTTEDDMSPPSASVLRWTPVRKLEGQKSDTIIDEQLVNTALINLLKCISACMTKDLADWSSDRHAFVLKNVHGKKIFEARVDGYLQKFGGSKPCIIVEVKPFYRYTGAGDKIRMQEGAQMAAWIHAHPPDGWEDVPSETKFRPVSRLPSVLFFSFYFFSFSCLFSNIPRRILVSQDHREVYVTEATFTAGYVGYLLGKEPDGTEPTFLRMIDYGPFVVDEKDLVKVLGPVILTLVLEKCEAWKPDGP